MEIELEELLEPAEIRALLPAGRASNEVAREMQAQPFELPSFDDVPPGKNETEEAQVTIEVELGRAILPADEAAGLRDSSVVLLDKLAVDPVDVVVDGRLLARGEVLVLNDRLCVRIAELFALPPAG